MSYQTALLIDEVDFRKKGKKSIGVAPQHLSYLGKNPLNNY